MEENNYQPEENVDIYISDSSEDENAEITLYAFSNIIKFIGFGLGGLCVLFGLIACISGGANFLVFLVALIAGAIVCFLFLVYASAIKVFANISMSLKDITKLLNK